MKKGKIKVFICHLSSYIISFLVENIFDGDQGDEEYFIWIVAIHTAQIKPFIHVVVDTLLIWLFHSMFVFCWNLILLLEGNIFPAFLKHSRVDLVKFADLSFPQDRTSTRSETSTRCGRASRPTSSTRSRATRDWQTSKRTPYSNHIKTFSPGCRRWPKMWRSPLSSTTTATSPRWTWSATLLLSPSPIKNWPAFTSGCSRQEDKRCLGSSNHTLHRLDEKS